MTDSLKIGRSKFLSLCPQILTDFPQWQIKSGGIYFDEEFINNDEPHIFVDEWAEVVLRHPEVDESLPILSFPCSVPELEAFVEWVGLGALYSEEDLSAIIMDWKANNVEPQVYANTLKAEGKDEFEVAAHLKGRYGLSHRKIAGLVRPELSSKPSTLKRRGTTLFEEIKGRPDLKKIAKMD